MFVSLRTVHLPLDKAGQRDHYLQELHKAVSQLPGVRHCYVVSAMDGVTINAGQLIWRMVFANEREASDIVLTPVWQNIVKPLLADTMVAGVGYYSTRCFSEYPAGGVWRALIFRIMPGFPDRAARLQQQLPLMPKYVSSIRNWAFNPVTVAEGPKTFSFVWEQEFDQLDGLTGEYMTHPIHWGVVDGYFDAEHPDYVVDPGLVQLVGAIDSAVIHRD